MSLLLTILFVGALAWVVCVILKVTLWFVVLAVCVAAAYHLVNRKS